MAAKIIKRQNNPETRNILLKGIETLTKVIHKYSGDRCKIDFTGSSLIGMKEMGLGWSAWGGHSHKIETKADSVIGGSGVLSMAPTKQIVLYAGHLHRPIVGQTPLFYKNEEYKAKAAIKPAPPMPKGFIKNNENLAVVSQMQMDEGD